jgi:hypothetical protein
MKKIMIIQKRCGFIAHQARRIPAKYFFHDAGDFSSFNNPYASIHPAPIINENDPKITLRITG